METDQTKSASVNWTGLGNLLIVYIIWGSTYLFIRIGVKPGSGFPPLYLAGTRVLTAGLILLGSGCSAEKAHPVGKAGIFVVGRLRRDALARRKWISVDRRTAFAFRHRRAHHRCHTHLCSHRGSDH